jgi:hypothetical protein
MVTSAECRVRAKQKLADANLHPRHERRLRSAAEGGLIRLEAIVSGSPSLDRPSFFGVQRQQSSYRRSGHGCIRNSSGTGLPELH